MSNDPTEAQLQKPVILSDPDIKFIGMGAAYADLCKDDGTPIDNLLGIRVDLAFVGPQDRLLSGINLINYMIEVLTQLKNDEVAQLQWLQPNNSVN